MLHSRHCIPPREPPKRKSIEEILRKSANFDAPKPYLSL